jgi:hypothetical protein
MYNKAWDSFFGNPILKNYLEEAEMPPEDQASQGEPQESNADIEGLSKDFQDGHLTQDDLINMYKAGKITKDDIQQIISAVENGGQEGEPQNPDEEVPTEE